MIEVLSESSWACVSGSSGKKYPCVCRSAPKVSSPTSPIADAKNLRRAKWLAVDGFVSDNKCALDAQPPWHQARPQKPRCPAKMPHLSAKAVGRARPKTDRRRIETHNPSVMRKIISPSTRETCCHSHAFFTPPQPSLQQRASPTSNKPPHKQKSPSGLAWSGFLISSALRRLHFTFCSKVLLSTQTTPPRHPPMLCSS